jgi:hypothetical protein
MAFSCTTELNIGSRMKACSSLALLLVFGCGPAGEIQDGEEIEQVDDSSYALKLAATATASSQESSTLGPEKAIDGNTGTRWSSAFSDPQWIRLDLGATKTLSRVVLNWEAAYSTSYEIQLSDNGTNWTTAYSTTTGDGGIDDLAISGSARYVRMYSTKRKTVYGNSLWEFEVHAPDSTTTPPPPSSSAIALPAKIEAEKPVRFYDTTAGNAGDASCSSTNVDAQFTTDPAGGTCNVGWTAATEWLEWDVSVASTANFDIVARLASNTTGKSVHVEIDGANVSGTLTAPSSGWQAFADVVKSNVSIAAGTHKLRVVMDTGSTNVNYVNIKPPGTTSPPPPPTNLDACKRGVAYGHHSLADMQALSSDVVWWYNWAQKPDSGVVNDYKNLGVEFVPMLWDEQFDVTTATNNIPSGARTLLGFNEPNFFSQANLSPTQAAAKWPDVERVANAKGLKIASPALNYCGPSGSCWETDPFVYFDKFFAACPNCRVDYLAVHWYACTLGALQNYIGKMKKYNRPIWLTEFACGDGDTSLANQKAYMQAAVPYLESEPAVAKYAWFSGRTTAIPNVDLLSSSGTLTDLGRIYTSLAHNASCPK